MSYTEKKEEMDAQIGGIIHRRSNIAACFGRRPDAFVNVLEVTEFVHGCFLRFPRCCGY